MGSWSLFFGQVGSPSTLRSGRSLAPLARLEHRVCRNCTSFARGSLARVVLAFQPPRSTAGSRSRNYQETLAKGPYWQISCGRGWWRNDLAVLAGLELDHVAVDR